MDNDQDQQASQEVDPIQQMIQQALASKQDQSAQQPTQVAAAEPAERPSLGTRIGEKQTPAPIIKVAQPGAPSPDSISPQGSGGAVAPVVSDLTNKSVPPPPPPDIGGLVKQQAEFGKPLDRNAIDPATGKSKYKMGWGSRLAGILGNAATGFATRGQGAATYVGKGATNHQFDVDESTRQANLANVNTQIGTQKDLSEENRKLYEANTQGQQREVQGQVAQLKGEVAQQLADAKDVANQNAAKYNDDRTETALKKLEEQARRNDQMNQMGMDKLAQQRQISDLAMQLKQQQMDASNAQKTTGTDAKSLEAERKQRITSVENDWKQHPYLNKIFGSSKESQIKAVNDEIDGRLQGVGVATGQPAAGGASAAAPAPKTHVFSKSAWAKANPGKDANAAAAMAKKQNFQVTD